jgi:hypothetical protein
MSKSKQPADKRQILEAVVSIATRKPVDDKCGFPECGLEPFHDGDHNRRGRHPREPIVCVQHVNTCEPRWAYCEMHDATCATLAYGLFNDARGYGWLLCWPCASFYGVIPPCQSTH